MGALRGTVVALLVAAIPLVSLAGCGDDTSSRTDTTERRTTTSNAPPEETTHQVKSRSEETRAGERGEEAAYGFTHGLPSGNRVSRGAGELPGSEQVDVDLGGTPLWVAGAPSDNGVAWAVALEDGSARAFRLDAETGAVEERRISPDSLPPGAPPALEARSDGLKLLTAPEDGASPFSHPLPADGGPLGVREDGSLRASAGEAPPVRALPDARLVEGADGRIAVFADPTSRYEHAVLGDGLEAGSIAVLEPDGAGYRVTARVRAESGGVFEGLAPIWFEKGGRQLLAVTESAAGVGARISVYDPDGGLVAAGPFVGEPLKWRHLLAIGPFGPDEETEISATRTPHLEPTTEFYGLDAREGELRIVAEAPGYPSHAIGSRNLDSAAAGDLDGDGRWELLLPDTDKDALVAVRRGRGGAVEEAWRLPLGGALSTNIASAADRNGRISVAAGTADGRLRIWP